MIKNVIIGILLVLCVLLLVYSSVQQSDATKAQGAAQESALLARKAQEEAKRQQTMAEANAKEVRRQLLIAEQYLLECTQKKKK